jgi:ribonuclease M5
MKPRCNHVILVEGKYDQIRLSSCLDATVLTTDGFGIFHDEEKRRLIQSLAKQRGIVILCDPDGAGQLIRSHLHTVTGGKGIIDLYVPSIRGKERRKAKGGKAGLLGVEGISNETILSLFERAGLLQKEASPRPKRYTKGDLYRLGYAGGERSREKRSALLKAHQFPESLSSNAFLELINLLEITL